MSSDSSENSKKNTIREYTSEAITVQFDTQRCIHAAECVRGLPQVFDPQKRPWVQPAAASADEIASVVQRCPTGALHYTRSDGGPAEPTPAETTMHVAANGPLFVRGNIEISTADGSLVLRDTRVALCRCGGTGNQPFCDGTHARNGFQDPGTRPQEEQG
jgi:uncharacterized Fe-S cluster protein YjdI/CDGSH-type Zn-finger protein